MLLQRTYGHNGARENTRVFSNADETRFTALNPVKDAAYWVKWTLHAPIDETYIMIPACAYDGNRFDISYVRYAPYITDWEMPRKPNRPVVTTNIHHLYKNGADSRIDILSGETSSPMIGYWDSVKKEGHLYLADPSTPLGETGFSVRESPTNRICTFVISAPGIRSTKYTVCRSRRQDCGDRALDIKKDTEVTFGVSVVNFKAENIDEFFARAFDVRKLRTGRTNHAKVEDPEVVIQQILANEDANHWYEDKQKGIGYYCNKPNGNSPFGHIQLGWNGIPVYLLPLLERPTPERLRRCALCWDAISTMNGKSGLYYAINRRGEFLGDAFGKMDKLRDHKTYGYYDLLRYSIFAENGVVRCCYKT